MEAKLVMRVVFVFVVVGYCRCPLDEVNFKAKFERGFNAMTIPTLDHRHATPVRREGTYRCTLGGPRSHLHRHTEVC